MTSAGTQPAVRYGVLGGETTHWQSLLPALSSSAVARTAAVVLRDANSLVSLSRQFEIPAIYRREEDLLADSSVDAVVIASPPERRLTLVRLALDAGKHVLIVGAPAQTVAEWQEVAQSADLHPGLAVRVATAARLDPAHLALRQSIADQAFGPLVHVRVLVRVRRLPSATPAGLARHVLFPAVDLVGFLTGVRPEVEAAHLAAAGDRLLVGLALPGGATAAVEAFGVDSPPDVPDRVEVLGERGDAGVSTRVLTDPSRGADATVALASVLAGQADPRLATLAEAEWGVAALDATLDRQRAATRTRPGTPRGAGPR